jgi:hypothetical protein
LNIFDDFSHGKKDHLFKKILFEENKCIEIMNNFIVIGAQCDDASLLDLIQYRKKVE